MRQIALTGLALIWAMPAFAEQICTDPSATHLVRLVTDLGPIDLDLCPDDVPDTVSNFLAYVNSGAYTDTGFIHRSVQESIFIFQGGGFFVNTSSSGAEFIDSVETQNPIDMEHVLPNRRGTIAMARTGNLNSATSQWFINVEDNPSFDTEGNPYAVFGGIRPSTMGVVDAIAALPIVAITASSPFNNTPVHADYSGDTSAIPYLVRVSEVIDLPEPSRSLQALVALTGLALWVRVRRSGLMRQESRG